MHERALGGGRRRRLGQPVDGREPERERAVGERRDLRRRQDEGSSNAMREPYAGGVTAKWTSNHEFRCSGGTSQGPLGRLGDAGRVLERTEVAEVSKTSSRPSGRRVDDRLGDGRGTEAGEPAPGDRDRAPDLAQVVERVVLCAHPVDLRTRSRARTSGGRCRRARRRSRGRRRPAGPRDRGPRTAAWPRSSRRPRHGRRTRVGGAARRRPAGWRPTMSARPLRRHHHRLVEVDRAERAGPTLLGQQQRGAALRVPDGSRDPRIRARRPRRARRRRSRSRRSHRRRARSRRRGRAGRARRRDGRRGDRPAAATHSRGSRWRGRAARVGSWSGSRLVAEVVDDDGDAVGRRDVQAVALVSAAGSHRSILSAPVASPTFHGPSALVAQEIVDQAEHRELDHGAPLDEHLAEQVDGDDGRARARARSWPAGMAPVVRRDDHGVDERHPRQMVGQRGSGGRRQARRQLGGPARRRHRRGRGRTPRSGRRRGAPSPGRRSCTWGRARPGGRRSARPFGRHAHVLCQRCTHEGCIGRSGIGLKAQCGSYGPGPHPALLTVGNLRPCRLTKRRWSRSNERFYAAFEAADLDAMSDLWEHSDRVSCIHPGWAVLRGWSAVAASWPAMFQGPEHLQFILTDEHVKVDGDAAWVTVDENIIGAESGTVASLNLFAQRRGRVADGRPPRLAPSSRLGARRLVARCPSASAGRR